MALSDYDFNLTRNEIIARAYRIIGKLDEGETMSAEMLSRAIIALNVMVKSWQNETVYLWTLREFTQSLSAGTKSYSLASQDPAIHALDRAWWRDGTTDHGVHIASWRQYEDLYDKDSEGDPTLVALDNRISPTMYIWPVPTQTRTLHVLGIVKLKDFDTAGGNADFPVRWLNALTYGLAAELGMEYGLPGGEMDRLERKASREFARAKTGERERADYEFVDGAFD